jgi:hypothetical protein
MLTADDGGDFYDNAAEDNRNKPGKVLFEICNTKKLLTSSTSTLNPLSVSLL